MALVKFKVNEFALQDLDENVSVASNVCLDFKSLKRDLSVARVTIEKYEVKKKRKNLFDFSKELLTLVINQQIN